MILKFVLTVTILFNVSFVIQFSSGQDTYCPIDCFRGIVPHSTNCYCISHDKKNWNDAKRHCQSRGMRLVMIESASEERMLTYQLEIRGYRDLIRGRFWTAGSDASREGAWQWASRSELGFDHDIFYTNWCPGEPNNFGGRENYLLKVWANPSLMKIESCWNDAPADWQNSFICEIGPSFN